MVVRSYQSEIPLTLTVDDAQIFATTKKTTITLNIAVSISFAELCRLTAIVCVY